MGAYGPPAGFYRNKPRVRIDALLCTACMRCVRACPRSDVLGAVKVKGKLFARVQGAENCVGCGRCVNACLTNAIGLYLV
ncbi:4Fe-4S dicluster domain-containing protein [Gordonibacter massiliensis (ex Traore et al. 2017)]|uniref:4Fe-4S dicluster domain-containing protein n=1 Tax=Gordonibacter massiliensis (ex Traore et al. 2017) TaxID=1841863 RepID=UPI001C8BEC50|nr:4Fe-4S dicluster domain-containing protein [Gordonibacter massiliensis (ex Traore et al. 2017)]MBX9034967.1 4Fe-4S binding protein [Gordonibacter massiliensis (ex Traore et al. 2017)]